MDYDDIQSYREASPEPQQLDDFEEDVDDFPGRDRSQTPVYDTDPSKSKPRKRLIKKSDTGKQSVVAPPPELEDELEEDRFRADEEEEGRKRKKGKDVGSGKKEKRLKGEKRVGSSSGKSGSKFGGSKKGFGGKGGNDHDDGEVKEMWDTIAGGDSEVLFFFVIFHYYIKFCCILFTLQFKFIDFDTCINLIITYQT
jgi:transcription factor SPN1